MDALRVDVLDEANRARPLVEIGHVTAGVDLDVVGRRFECRRRVQPGLVGTAGRKSRPRDSKFLRRADAGSSSQPVAIDKARIERQMRELALEHATGGLGDEAYLARLKALRQQRGAITERTAAGTTAERAIEWLRALGESLQASDASKEKADVMHAIYDRITVAGPEIVGVRLTQAAYAHGLALALAHQI